MRQKSKWDKWANETKETNEKDLGQMSETNEAIKTNEQDLGQMRQMSKSDKWAGPETKF